MMFNDAESVITFVQRNSGASIWWYVCLLVYLPASIVLIANYNQVSFLYLNS